jgi:hypothetical protein
MRLLALVALLAVVGCTTTEENKPPAPHQCAGTFSGAWRLVGTALGDGGCGAPKSVEMTITIDDALTKIAESYDDGTSSELKTAPLQSCDSLIASRVESVPDGTQLTSSLILASPKAPERLTGVIEINLYEPSDFETNRGSATPICKVVYDTVLTR